jgi:hypothetical protein
VTAQCEYRQQGKNARNSENIKRIAIEVLKEYKKHFICELSAV